MAHQTPDRGQRHTETLLSCELEPIVLCSSQRTPECSRKNRAGHVWGVLGRVRHFSKQMKSRRKELDPIAHAANTEDEPLVCLLEESPLRILKVASRGNLEEFIKLYTADPSRLNVRDSKGQRPLHVAAAKGHKNIVDFIISQYACLDAADANGDTALHAAVRHDHPEVVEALLDGGADHTILNHESMAPLHVVSDLGYVECLKAMMKNPNVDRNIAGDNGLTPLHYCSIKDHAECAYILLKNTAKPCSQCFFGYFPLHLAAKNAAAKTLEVIIQQGIENGYDRATLLTFKDRENNMPLHAAVNGGNIKAVEVCLKAGAPVNSQQDDKSTPIHFAAAQGNLDMIQLMYIIQEDNFLAALDTTDAMDMTPLHRAALFNHKAVVIFLLEKGADINSQDSRNRTPLLLAASKGCWDTVQELVERGADVQVRDWNSRNFLHLAIRFGGKLGKIFDKLVPDNEKQMQDPTLDETSVVKQDQVKKTSPPLIQNEKGLKHLLDEKDEFGCTPLHYASKEGHLLALEDLINLGATPSLKNNEKKSPFHFAARYGRYNTCRRLLELSQGPNIINETDGDGLTGLHIAAQNGHTKIITLLLQKGAVINRDNDDNTPLHHAAAQGWTQCMRILLSIHSNLLNVKNIRGETALHLAAQNGRATAVSLLLSMGAALERDMAEKNFFDYIIDLKLCEVAMAVVRHDRWEEALICLSIPYGCPFLGLIEHMPLVCEAVLDKCQVPSGFDKRSSEYYIEYNFKFLNCPIKCIETAKKAGEFQPLMTLNAMVRHGRVNCLSHPVCVSFLKLKWNTYGLWFYMLLLGLYLLFLASLTMFVVKHNSLEHHDPGNVDNKTYQMLHGNKDKNYDIDALSKCAMWIVAIFSVLSMVKELVQMITQRQRYFADFQNAFEWTLYLTSLLFAAPFLMNFSYHWQWEAGALAVFFAWFNLLVILQRFDFFGIYVVMFLEILRTLVQALSVFSVLIVAFGLAFYILLSHEDTHAYSTPGMSLMRTTMMMLELDYMASFSEPYTDGNKTTLHFGGLTLFMVLTFVLLMPILLMNLLIGLAVGDIEAVQRNARLKRLAGQVELHTDMEGKMPLSLLARFDQPVYKHFPNKCKNKLASFWSRMTVADREDHVGGSDDIHRGMVIDELLKQKQKVKEMGVMLEKNNQLLRLIVQKMEIHTEDDAWDEGHDHDKVCTSDNVSPRANGRQSPGKINFNSFRRKMLNKTSAITYMKDGREDK